MARRTGYSVVPRNKGKWAVVKDGSSRASSTHRKKSAAVRKGKKLAKKHKPSSLKIQGRDGRIQQKHSYGSDPRRYKG